MAQGQEQVQSPQPGGIDIDRVAKLVGYLQIELFMEREVLAATRSELKAALAKLATLEQLKKEATCPGDKANP